MKILLLSAMLALAAANVIPAEQSENQDAQKPGMCFEDYFRKHHDDKKKFMNKMTERSEESSDPAAHRRGPPPHDKQEPHDHQEDGAHHHGHPKPWHLIDFSKLRNCSMDQDCDDADKCCRTMCGMRCTRPFFEDHKMRNQEHHWHGKKANKQGDGESENKQGDDEEQRVKQQASSRGEDWSDTV